MDTSFLFLGKTGDCDIIIDLMEDFDDASHHSGCAI